PPPRGQPRSGRAWLWRSAFAWSPDTCPWRRPPRTASLGCKHPPAEKVPAMTPMDMDEVMMRRALQLAKAAAGHGDVPIGAVVARGDEVLGQAGNERELRRDPTAHAEVLALREAAERLGGWRLLETTLY